ncbi:MAG: response regulator [candidate division Zixibacteria bacterium]|nr:response regulator [candidate division Zixibacteria bacterium]
MNSLPMWLGAILSALMIISILVFSDRFSRCGLTGWKTTLFGMALVFVAFLARAVMSLENFSQLFVPGIPDVVSQISEIIIAVGAVTAALSMFVAVRKLSFDREAEKQKESEFQFLNNLKNIIFEPYSLVEVLNFSLNEISRTLDDCRGAIYIYNPSSKELYLTSSVKLDKSQEATLEKISLDSDIISRSQKVSRPHTVGKLSHSDKATQELLATMNIESAMTAPLMSRNGSVGVILILGETPYQFTRRESEILNSAANLLGPVVASFRMEREIRQLTEQISVSADKSRKQIEILSALDGDSELPERLGVLLEYGEETLRADGMVLAAKIGAGDWSIIKTTDDSPFAGDIPNNFTRHFDKTVQNGKTVIVKTVSPDTDERARFLIFPVGGGETEPCVLVASIPTERESFSPDEISRMQLVLRLIRLVLPQLQSRSGVSEFDGREFADCAKSLLQSFSESEIGKALEKTIYGLIPEYDAGMILALEQDRQSMRVFTSFGYDGGKVNGFELRAGNGPWGTAHKLGTEENYSERHEIERVFLSLAGEDLSWFMERSSSRKLPSFCRTVPLNWNDRRIGVLFLEGSDEPPELQEESPIQMLLFDLLAYKLESFTVGRKSADGYGGIPVGSGAVNNLNQINNALTGIIGKAQLLGFGLKEESLTDGKSVLLNLDMIADEAFQAGELIKQLQREIREENSRVTDSAPVDLSEMLKQLTIVRYGSDPNLHYLRENPGVSFEADLSSVAPVPGEQESVRPLISEVLQWVWDEFEVDEHMLINLQDKEGFSYLIVSDHSLGGEEADVGNLVYRPLEMHPDLSQSEAVDGFPRNSVSFYEKNRDEGDRLFCLRFDQESVQTEQVGKSLDILAIDDQEIIRELLTGMLDQLGYNVTVCSTGVQGVEEFTRGRFDLVICDIGLPDIDGWEVVERIKSHKPDTPIIMISGWGLNEEVEKAGRRGIDHILPKPFRLENLSELIEKVKSRRATA